MILDKGSIAARNSAQVVVITMLQQGRMLIVSSRIQHARMGSMCFTEAQFVIEGPMGRFSLFRSVTAQVVVSALPPVGLV